MKQIAVIITCHNRVDKTTCCLETFKKALTKHNSLVSQEDQIKIHVYLTDDGCTDGTAEQVGKIYGPESLTVIKGDGNLYWAGGMRKAWNYAINSGINHDYYLLLNDDTDVFENVFSELMQCEKYAYETFGRCGIYSGICCSTDRKSLTYGGDIITNYLLFKPKRLGPTGSVQQCDMTNANILLIPGKVVDEIGIFYSGYLHGKADNDYSFLARKKGIPVLLTPDYCGECDYDHGTEDDTKRKIINMSRSERRKYFHSPLHSSKDHLTLVKRITPLRYPLVWLGRFLNENFPKLYYAIHKI
ncbi:MAG: glycosyltransferase [Muribaculum sp.]|nr:glycosyltransferase [Muribaculum sp.]